MLQAPIGEPKASLDISASNARPFGQVDIIQSTTVQFDVVNWNPYFASVAEDDHVRIASWCDLSR
jgi:hypothetical protein